MKIGLLLCDHVNSQWVGEHGTYPDMFQRLFPEYQFKVYDVVNGIFPSSIDECTAYMGTGSRFSVYEDLDWIHATMEFIQALHKAKRCFVGVCFSHQLIGEALGGKVTKSEKGWSVGVQRFEPFGFNLIMMCQDQITTLPPEAKVLAGSKLCANGIISIGDHILGIQAHPEFTKAYDRVLIESRIDKIGKKTAAEGLDSLDLQVDTDAIRAFIIKFISEAV